MLTIQPKFTQRLHSQLSFRGDYDDDYDDENFDDKSQEEKDLTVLKEDITSLNNGLKKYENNIQKFKPVTRTLCLIGSGALMGVGTKLGWNETGKLLKKVMANPTVIKGRKNIAKFGEKISTSIKKFRDEKFAKTPIGAAILGFFKKLGETKPVMAVKNLFAKVKNVKSGAIADTTGDVVAFSTGVSTTVAGALPDKKKAKEKDSSEDLDLDYDDDEVNYDDED